MKTNVFLRGLLVLLLFTAACRPAAPDYAAADSWYGEPSDTCPADIFYVYPTVGTNPEADYADLSDPAEREAAAANQQFNREAYARGNFNFYAPYYRQVTMKVYGEPASAVRKKSRLPERDIADAFRHYLDEWNDGRPFILLGHSQGSSVLLELLKNMDDETFGRMIAAYLIGWQITEEELEAFPQRLRPAQGATDTGVVVLYNSLADPAAKSPLIARSAVCINPLNWRTDGTPATKEEHLGIIRRNPETGGYDLVPGFRTGAAVRDHYLICPDIDPEDCYIEAYKELFPRGNLHFMDSWLYSANLRKNMEARTAAFFDQTP